MVGPDTTRGGRVHSGDFWSPTRHHLSTNQLRVRWQQKTM